VPRRQCIRNKKNAVRRKHRPRKILWRYNHNFLRPQTYILHI